MTDLKQQYFWVEFEETGATLTWNNSIYNIYNFAVEYSFDGILWETARRITTALIGKHQFSMGDKTLVFLRTTTRSFTAKNGDKYFLDLSSSNYHKVGGDISSMTDMNDSCLSHFFDGDAYLTDASELILPWDVLSNGCYDNMFVGCSSLERVPQLPATTLAANCYLGMFGNCTSLTTAPELPATTLADSCYRDMFFGCTSLTTAPTLPATTLANNCYLSMFFGCTSLTTAPTLPATTLASHCYHYMFLGCTSLTTAPTLPATTLASHCYYFMFQDCTSLTTAPQLPATTLANQCYRAMFDGCTSLTTAPQLPATTLADSCYELMFRDCTSLTTAPQLPATTLEYACYADMFNGCTSLESAPQLPATTLADRCYDNMFNGCTSLKYIKMIATDISASDCLSLWVENVAPTGTFIKSAENTVIPIDSVHGIPAGWTVYNEGEEPKEEPEIIPQIRLYKTNLEYTSNGGPKYIQIDYYGATTILEPTCTHSWVTIEKTQSGYYDEGGVRVDQQQYRITLEPTEVERQTNVVFSCTDELGNVYTEDSLVLHQSAPIPPATITIPRTDLKNGVLVFDYTGGTKTIRLNIDGYTKPIDITHSVTDLNYSVHVLSSEMAYDDGYNYAVWHINIGCEGNDSDYAYEGSIDIHYTDEGTDETITIPFHVRYETEGLIEPFGNNLKYDKDGNLLTSDNFVNIGYLNIATINTPTCSDWITVSARQKEEGPFSTYDEVYRYNIAVAPNSGGERNGIITFTGIGVDGKTYSANITLFQEGDDTEIVIDEGYIELQSLSMVLPSEGGSDTFQVKYYDAAEILDPEFMANWATIEKISESTEQGVAWNGEECLVTTVTYKVTAQKSTSGRQAKVLCKLYINNEDSTIYMEKDKFVVYQLAPDSSEVQGSVSVLRYSKTYTYYGSAIGFDPEVGYIKVVPQLPMIDVDWCRVKNITDSTSKEYDIIKAYDIEMDVNPTQFPRTCVITFIGKGGDGTYVETSITVTQEGQSEDINEGVYSNYKGYFRAMDCTLYSVSFITNPSSDVYGEIMLAGEAPVLVSYTESERIYTPIRTSTCTVRVVSSQYLMNLYTGKAQGTQVILKNEDTGEIEWCGYLQPNLYNQGFSEPIEEIEFEASDCLSGLQYFKYENCYANGRFLVSFKDIVDNIMDRCKLINSYFITQKMYSDGESSRVMKFVNFNISEYNFYSEEDEPWTLQEVLEEICKYMGYVCLQWGDSIYFIDYDMYTVNKTMIGLRWDKETKWLTENMVAISGSNNIITEESYKETGGSMSLDDVFNKVTVNCNYYNIDNLIPDLFDDDLLTNRLGENVITSISRYGGTGNSVLLNKTFYRVYDHKNIDSIFYIPIADISNHETIAAPTEEDFSDKYFFRNYVGGNIVDMVHLTYNEANGEPGESKEFERYLMISQLNRPWCGAEGTFHWENYNLPIMEFKDLPVIHIDNTADEIERVPARSVNRSLSSNRPANPKPAPNYLIINAEAAFVPFLNSEYVSDTIEKGLEKKSGQSYYTYGDYTFDNIRNMPSLCFYLEIPQKGWWDGTEWVDYKTYFEVPLEYFGEDKDDDKWYEDIWATTKNVKNNVETYLFLGASGYRIPLPKEMDTTRDMYFAIAMPKRFVHLSDIRGGDDTGEVGNAYCFIKNLEMKIVNRNTILYDDDDVIFENIIDEGNVIDGDEISLRITSDNHQKFSLSTVSTRTISDELITDFMFYNKNYELLKPEEAIIERYVNQYSTPSIKTNITLDMSFKPFQLITDTYWNKDFVITGQEIDYQRGKQTITLLEKK